MTLSCWTCDKSPVESGAANLSATNTCGDSQTTAVMAVLQYTLEAYAAVDMSEQRMKVVMQQFSVVRAPKHPMDAALPMHHLASGRPFMPLTSLAADQCLLVSMRDTWRCY